VTIVWVQSNSDLNTSPHTLILNSAQGNNLILQEYAAAPAFSPDGNKIAFYSESSQSGYNTGIWVADLIEGSIENAKLLVDVTNVQNLAWSPNEGDKLVFEVVLNPSSPLDQWQSEIRIVLSDVADGYVELDRFEGRQPAWSSDGQRLVFYICRGSQCGLFLVNCVGGTCDEASSEQLTFDSTDSYPAWSPTGDSIAFASARTGNQEIYHLRLADKSLQNLTNRPTIDTTPIFNLSGQQLYFRTDLDGVWQLQVIDLARGNIAPFIPNIGGNDRSWGLVRPVVR
jgi:Tol biopolymer transport system component